MAEHPKLLFIDTNIWLDLYRGRGDASLKLLKRVEKLASRLIVTDQVEVEFRRNRQQAILEGMRGLRKAEVPTRLGIFSEDNAAREVIESAKTATRAVESLRKQLLKMLRQPEQHDQVYSTCMKLFRKRDGFTLRPNLDKWTDTIERAETRHKWGYPPQKEGSNSIGDAINWEWMLSCVQEPPSDLIIVTRDADYGVTYGEESFVNDYLQQEFKDAAGSTFKLHLFTRLTDGLKAMNVKVSEDEVKAENEARAVTLVRQAKVVDIMEALKASLAAVTAVPQEVGDGDVPL